jgi:hypothetical protein
VNFAIEGTGGNTLSCGSNASHVQPLQDVRLMKCHLIEHPLVDAENHRTNRVISCYQTALQLIDVEARMPNTHEHLVYSRNPHGLTRLKRVHVYGIGGNVLQVVDRPSEGPHSTNVKVEVDGCWLQGYQQDPGRAGGAITIAGGSADTLIRDNVLVDVDGLSYAAIVFWDGERYYTREGVPIEKGQFPPTEIPTGAYANNTATIQNNVVVHANANRDVISLSSLRTGLVTRNEFRFSGQEIALDALTRGQRGDRRNRAGVGTLLWDQNNRMSADELERAGVPTDDAESDPKVMLRGQILGAASETHAIANGSRLQ